jgi:hypothetical protein
VRAVEYPRVTRDGKVEIPKDHWTNYEMVISDPERFYVNPEPQPKPAAEGKPVSPGEAVAKAQEPLTVEFTVGSVGMLLGPVATGADARPPIHLDWDGKLKGGGRFYVMLWGDATEGGSARFKGKTVRVTGRIQAAQQNDASTDYYFTIKAPADIKVVK